MPSDASNQNEAHTRFELKTILETGRVLIESNDADFISNNLLLITLGKLMITRGAVLLYDPTTPDSQYQVKRKKGQLSLEEGQFLTLKIDESQKDQAILYPRDLNNPQVLRESGSFLLFNLRTSDYHLGFLLLGSKISGDSLSEREKEFVESLALMSSVALSNSRMIQELQRTNRKLDRKVYELKTLFELSKDFNMMVDREKIAETFKFAMLGQLLIRKFFFILDTGEERRIISSSGIQDQPESGKIEQLFNLPNDVTEVDRSLRQQIPFLEQHRIEAVIGLQFQQEKLAIVGVGDRAGGGRFTESDYDFISSLGNLALLSIQKTFLMEERIEKERMEEELNIAQSIQQALLPSPLPDIPRMNLFAKTDSSYQVGGDFFDIIEISTDRYLFAIGDVSGKGVPAALLMANLQSILRTLKPFEISMGQATGHMNDIIHENTPSDKFITFFWAAYEPSSGTLTYVNAGHNAPILFREGADEPLSMEEGGLILGAMPTMNSYQENQLQVKAGDILVLYTDGVTEAMNKQEEQYGEERLMNCIRNHRDADPQILYQYIREDIAEFTGGKTFDDLTLMILQIN